MSTTEQTTVCNQEHQSEQSAKPRNWRRPHYNVAEKDDAFNVSVTLPGVKREGVDISVEDEVLTIVGTRSVSPLEDWRPLRREIPDADFRMSLQLNVAINEAKISARVEDGILELTLPKADEVKPRKISVS
ncbi:MAG: Hsp20/alpha crystallin family protein [Opitutaceae bacterium]